MALVAGVKFHFDLNFAELELEETERYLKEVVSKFSNPVYRQETDVYVQLEDGSLKVTLAIVGALYIAIGQYGSFRSGVDYLIKDSKAIKELVQSEIVRNGLSDSRILYSKRMHCDPDRIRRVLLAIDRLESKQGLPKEEIFKEVSKIRASVWNICRSIDDLDAGLFASEISEKYWPSDTNIPELVDRYRLVVREEDISPFPLAGPEPRRVNK